MFRVDSVNDDLCFPGMSCFPAIQDDAIFQQTLNGPVLYPYMEEYESVVIMRNTRKTKFPYMIVVAHTTQDVQKAVRMARKFNLKIVVWVSNITVYSNKVPIDRISVDIYLSTFEYYYIKYNCVSYYYILISETKYFNIMKMFELLF